MLSVVGLRAGSVGCRRTSAVLRSSQSIENMDRGNRLGIEKFLRFAFNVTQHVVLRVA